MRYVYWIVVMSAVSIVLGLGASRVQPQQKSQQKTSTSDDIQRGKYLVEEVAKCQECHTPRNQNNELDSDRWLQGAPTWIRPVFPTTDWAAFAPRLAGLPSYTDEQAERILEKGERANGGGEVQQPMHVYHMNHADAKAIVAYLRSLSVQN